MWPERKALALVLGSAIHKVLATQYEQLRDGKVLKEEEAMEVLLKALKSEPIDIDETKQTIDTIALDSKHIVQKICNNPLKIKPKNVERFFVVDFKNPLTGEILGPKLSGVIDLDTVDNEIIEHKSSGKLWTDVDIKNTLQHVVYHVGYYNLHKTLPKKIYYHVIYKQNKSGIDLFEVNISDIDVMNFFNVARSVINNIEKEIWNPTPSQFGCRFCDYSKVCLESRI